MLEVYAPKPGDEKKFFDKHKVEKHKNLGGKATEDDKVFQATNVKTVDREKEHGYNPDGSDEKVYESFVIEASDEDFAAKLADAYEDMKDHPQAGPHIKKAKKAMQGGDSESAYEHMKMAIKASRMNEEAEQVEEGRIDDLEDERREREEREADDLSKESKPRKKVLRKVAGKAYGGSKQKEDPEDVKEQTNLEESKAAEELYKAHHARVKDLLKKITSGVDAHKAACMKGGCHYGHAANMKILANTLQDMHDNIHMEGEYAKSQSMGPMREEVETNGVQESVTGALVGLALGAKGAYHAAKNTSPYGKKPYSTYIKNFVKGVADPRTYVPGKKTTKKTTKEEVEQVDEKKLTSAEMKKREEVAKAIERENPNMPMAKKMAIATATAKKVAEEREPVGIQLHFQHPETKKTSKEVVFSARHAAQREKEMKKAGYETVKRKLYYGK